MGSSPDAAVARVLVTILADSRWEAVALARGYLALTEGGLSVDEAAATMRRQTGASMTLTAARRMALQLLQTGLLANLRLRERMGSAENPVTKLFPATLTEMRFSRLLERLSESRPGIAVSDDRMSEHSLTDYTLVEGDIRVPVNVKNAGTRFERAQQLVGLDPDDCLPIPAYKAYAATEREPHLLYAVSVDFGLVHRISETLPPLFTPQEALVWDLLNRFSGSLLRSAEDAFICAVAAKYEDRLLAVAGDMPFHVVSARKAIRILQQKAERTPGIGLRAWGTGASAEVNVHLSLREDMTPWTAVDQLISGQGLTRVVAGIDRRRMELVFDPEF